MSRECPIIITDDSIEVLSQSDSSSSSSSPSSSSDSSSSSSASSSSDSSMSAAILKAAIPQTKPQVPPLKVPDAVSKTTTTTTTTTTAGVKRPIVNPYAPKKQPFIGGAELARRAARKRARTGAVKIMTPLERQRLDEVLPLRMNPMERFCAALLRSSATDFVQSDSAASDKTTLWKTICRRVGLTPPESPLLPRYDRPAVHFALRAALVLEEARHALAHPLAARWKHKNSNSGRGRVPSMVLRAQHVEINRGSGHVRVVFRKDTPFSRDELYDLRTGTVLECQDRDMQSTLDAIQLGVIFSSNREQIEAKREFSVTFFRQLPTDWKDCDILVRPLETLVTQLRSFEAMTVNPERVAFLQNLMGFKGATHIRFDDKGVATKSETKSVAKFLSTLGSAKSSLFRLPSLNPTQEKAAAAFLTAKPNTLSLCQGPPGTGKTTFAVTLIARYLMKFGDTKRIMVCAPTNKAISVLATRFMECFDQAQANFAPVMVGDADKLLADEKGSARKLRSILCYSWLPTIIEEYRSLCKHFVPGANKKGVNTHEVNQLALQLEKRLENGLYGLSEEFFQLAAKVSNALSVIQSGGGYDVVPIVTKLVKKLEGLQKTQPESVWRLLMANANVIFCTCVSAGGLILKNAPNIDDLVIDEAAAATEPELSIPFHLQPKRLFCIGDPLQLPATVLSRRATDLGLARSLHDRLMYQCNFDHIMLDVQYRMHPDISNFPSGCFYDSKIQDGANVQQSDHRQPPFVLDGRPYIFVNVQGKEEKVVSSGSCRNHAEAKAIVQMVGQLRDRAAMCDGRRPWHSTDRLRVITFYQGQVILLRRLLREGGFGDRVVVATVDSSQGCEADVVLVSFVRTPRQPGVDARVAAGFLTDDRRMNVAITRARHQLVCVGDVDGLACVGDGSDTIAKLALNAQGRCVVRPLCEES